MPAERLPKCVAVPIELQWNVPWHLDCFQGIVDFGKENGWQCVVDPYLDGTTGDGDLTGYDGFVGRIDGQNARRISDIARPAVNLLSTPRDHGLHSVRIDSIAGTKLAAEHLISHGYRRFGHISIEVVNKAYSDPIIQTFRQTITSRGLPEPDLISIANDALEQRDTSKACLQQLTEWIKAQSTPVGLYVFVYDVARYLAQICSQIGLRIPEDVGIVIQEDDQLNSTRMSPSLSAIAVDYWEQGYQAAAVLDRLMQGESVNPRNILIQPQRITVRESTDIFVCEDDLISQAMRYIAEHSRRTLTADEVADAVDVSRRTLDRRFEQVMGTTVRNEMVRLRINQIEQSLTDSKLKMANIAELFGFGSSSQFTQFFKKYAGITPSAYRKQYRTD